MSSVHYENTHLPEIFISPESREYSRWSHLHDCYAQFEVVALRLGYKRNAEYFRAKSLQMRRKSIVSETTIAPYSDRLILWFSEKISFYGQSMWKALRAILIFSIPTYIVLVSLGDNHTHWGEGATFLSTMKAIGAHVGHYLQFLLPTHDLELFGEGRTNLSSGFLAVDWFSRFALGYLLYHFVRTTRKFAA